MVDVIYSIVLQSAQTVTQLDPHLLKYSNSTGSCLMGMTKNLKGQKKNMDQGIYPVYATLIFIAFYLTGTCGLRLVVSCKFKDDLYSN